MKIICIDHIGIAANSINENMSFYTDTLGLSLAGTEEVTE